MSELVFSGGGRSRELEVVRRPGTRAMRLSVDPRDASVRLSMPPRAALRPALAWAAGKRAWVEAQLEKLPVAVPVVPGMVFELRGERVRLEWSRSYPRKPKLCQPRPRAGPRLTLAAAKKDSPAPDQVRGDDNIFVLEVGGPPAGLASRITRWLKAEALRTLETETRALCTAHDLAITTVGIGDPRGRWGSCSSVGRDSL